MIIGKRRAPDSGEKRKTATELRVKQWPEKQRKNGETSLPRWLVAGRERERQTESQRVSDRDGRRRARQQCRSEVGEVPLGTNLGCR